MRPKNPINVTLYHVAAANDTSIADNNLGDAHGDAEFMLRAAGLSYLCSTASGEANFTYDCEDAEQTGSGLVVTKLTVEVEDDFSEYAECNIADGVYSCDCRGSSYNHYHPVYVPCSDRVGRIPVVNESGWAHEKPDGTGPPFMNSAYRYYFFNTAQLLQGMWYSTLSNGQCGHAGTNCTWRVAETVKRVSKDCQQQTVFEAVQEHGAECFDGCPKPLNVSTACWTNCFYNTMLGPNANSTAYPTGAGAGLDADDLVAAWLRPFESDDPTKGGCPGI
jgi:hypothetical protein